MTALVSAIAKPTMPPTGEPRPAHDTSGPPSGNLPRLLAAEPQPVGPGFQSSI